MGIPKHTSPWYKVAGVLAQRFTVVLTDLRGYGDSSKPDGGPGHANYSKRTMGADQVQVMRSLGFDRFQVVPLRLDQFNLESWDQDQQ
jgi:haloacetate dehalogenase